MIDKIRFDQKSEKETPKGTDFGVLLDMEDLTPGKIPGTWIPKVKRVQLSKLVNSVFTNIVRVEPNAPDNIAGKLYRTYSEALTYILTSGSPTEENPWLIKLPSGEFDENIELNEFISIEGKDTILTGVVSSALFVTDPSQSITVRNYISGCEIRQFDFSNAVLPPDPDPQHPVVLLKDCFINTGLTDNGGAGSFGVIVAISSHVKTCDFRNRPDRGVYFVGFNIFGSSPNAMFGECFVEGGSFYGVYFSDGCELNSVTIGEYSAGIQTFLGGRIKITNSDINKFEMNRRNCNAVVARNMEVEISNTKIGESPMSPNTLVLLGDEGMGSDEANIFLTNVAAVSVSGDSVAGSGNLYLYNSFGNFIFDPSYDTSKVTSDGFTNIGIEDDVPTGLPLSTGGFKNIGNLIKASEKAIEIDFNYTELTNPATIKESLKKLPENCKITKVLFRSNMVLTHSTDKAYLHIDSPSDGAQRTLRTYDDTDLQTASDDSPLVDDFIVTELAGEVSIEAGSVVRLELSGQGSASSGTGKVMLFYCEPMV